VSIPKSHVRSRNSARRVAPHREHGEAVLVERPFAAGRIGACERHAVAALHESPAEFDRPREVVADAVVAGDQKPVEVRQRME
jgi:hypothetical protein